MQAPRMKLNQEQCSHLPFPIGCRVWYNIRTDDFGGSGAATNASTSTVVGAVGRGAAATEQGSSAPLSSESAVIGPNSIHGPLTFEHGVVSAAYLDVIASNILYEVKPEAGMEDEKTLDDRLYSDEMLYYGPGSPVYISRLGKLVKAEDSEEYRVPGQVLFCHLKRMTVVGDDSSEQISSHVTEIKQQLEVEKEDNRILDFLVTLSQLAIDLNILKNTRIGVVVAMLKKSKNVTVSMMAKELVSKWREIADRAPAAVSVPTPMKDGQPEFLYTVKVPHGNGSFHIERNIALDRVKYRHEANAKKLVAPTKSEPIHKTEKTKLEMKESPKAPCRESNAEPYVQGLDGALLDQPRCLVTSPSTLTHSDTTVEQTHSDLHSQHSGSKRKYVDDQARSTEQMKRSCLKSEGPMWTPPSRLQGTAQPSMIPQPLHSFSGRQEKLEETHNFMKIPLQPHHAPLIVGSNGHFIKDIERQTGCFVRIQGKGNKFDKFASNEPLHVKIAGTTSGIEKASGIIHTIIAQVDKSNDLPKATYNSYTTNTADPDRDSTLFCKVHFPTWLVHDDSSRARLHYFLNHNEMNNLNRIGQHTNCVIKIEERKGQETHVLIRVNGQHDLIKGKCKLRMAKEAIETALLDYIQNDGSAGRLLYDTAISCGFLHGYIDERSTTICQRNPFNGLNGHVFINIIELPYSRSTMTDAKEFHGRFLLDKHILGTVKHSTGCTVTIVGDKFGIPVKYCDPYVFISGERQQNVDDAYLIMTDKIKEMLNNHNNWIWNEHSTQRRHSLELFISKRSHFY